MTEFDAFGLIAVLKAGAIMGADGFIKATTKDAYDALKKGVVHLFGQRADKAIEKLADPAQSADGDADLNRAIPSLDAREVEELGPLVAAFRAAIKGDDAAQTAIKRANIRLDLVVEGNVFIERVKNVGGIDVKAKVSKDFALRDIEMSKEQEAGK